MPPFRFRLERVLEVRRREEDRERIAFAEATARRARAREVLEARRRAYRRTLEEEAARASFRVDELLARIHHRERQLRDILEAERDLESATAAWAEARARLVEARKKRRLLERLRERRYAEWRLEEERREQGILDEVGTVRFLYRRREAARQKSA